MKAFHLLAAPLLFLSTVAHAQTAEQPVKGADIIMIATPDSSARALVTFARFLQANGIAVDRIDKELLSITTKPTMLTKAAYASEATYLVIASPGANSLLTVTGKASTEVLNRKLNFPASYKGAENGTPLAAFRLMEAAAMAYPNGKITCKKQP